MTVLHRVFKRLNRVAVIMVRSAVIELVNLYGLDSRFKMKSYHLGILFQELGFPLLVPFVMPALFYQLALLS